LEMICWCDGSDVDRERYIHRLHNQCNESVVFGY
jgi:hypothetical protein